jgi:hypothetical protein
MSPSSIKKTVRKAATNRSPALERFLDRSQPHLPEGYCHAVKGLSSTVTVAVIFREVGSMAVKV